MRFPSEIEDALRRRGYDPEDVQELVWTQKVNERPELRVRFVPYAQEVNITLNKVELPIRTD